MARGEGLYRQWELLKTLQANRFGMTVDELAQHLDCTRRTVQRDLGVLQTVFPIHAEPRQFGRKHWLLSPGFLESEKLQLTMTEMLSLFLSQQLLSPLSGTQFGDGLGTAIQKIRALLPAGALKHFAALDDAFLFKSLGLEDYAPQSRQIALLNDAILHHRVLKVTYHSASQDRDLSAELHPYGMVLLAATLYCIGWLSEYGEVRTLKVSRLRQVRATGATFERPATFSLAKHTHGAFGVFGPGQLRPIRARFTGWAATNLREHLWHPSQRIVQDDGRTVVADFELSNTVEFKRWLLGFGRHAAVLRPRTLAKEILIELRAAAQSYDAT